MEIDEKWESGHKYLDLKDDFVWREKSGNRHIRAQ
ncbi:hypothetical protein SAMN05421799_109156 [Alicyclobacillus vulcanalis]|uniref:Uncharacterized protein n=1 Tax=Alicyclobacillus vulcanalis TaxID=252246 RepID=A0A1N7NSW5_9BACL|nr:hypothetical protein SAMN05421799_109156 [Alicyclobacillus vulcanalis]